jgi:Skp family chaperone for outer membrane proteins
LTGHAVPAQATQTIQAPAQPKERELDDRRKELQDIKRQLAEQEAERNVQKQNGPSKKKMPVSP